MSLKFGIFGGIEADEYHADAVAEVPTLNASIANLLCNASPLHAWTHHPKLNRDYYRVEEEKFDIGRAAHALFLKGEAGVSVIEAENWRTNAAQEARDVARAAGRIPLLAKHWLAVTEMTSALRDQVTVHDADPPLYADGKPEQTLVWEEPGGVVCRARLDWLRNDHLAIEDMKTTSRSANPESWSRSIFGMGGDVQAAFYIRAVQELTGEPPAFRWTVVETSPPYALSVISPAPDVLTVGAKKVQFALDLWRECLRKDHWPGYAREVVFAQLPPWEEARWLEREVEEAA